MSRLVIVLPLEPLTIGESFPVEAWPLHVTVLAPFATEAVPAVIADALAGLAAGVSSITARAGDDELFGRRHNIPVSLVDDHPGLFDLHDRLVEGIRPFASDPDEPAFTGSDFRAHVTMKQDRRVHAGDELHLTQLALVDMAARSLPGGRAVLATFPLGVVHPAD
jgi:2'-5' RNA ligase